MGGMFTVVKVREGLAVGDYRDPGWYRHPKGTIARRVSLDPKFGDPPRRNPYGSTATGAKAPPAATPMPDMPGMDHSPHGG